MKLIYAADDEKNIRGLDVYKRQHHSRVIYYMITELIISIYII